jgi:hypothetical protein
MNLLLGFAWGSEKSAEKPVEKLGSLPETTGFSPEISLRRHPRIEFGVSQNLQLTYNETHLVSVIGIGCPTAWPTGQRMIYPAYTKRLCVCRGAMQSNPFILPPPCQFDLRQPAPPPDPSPTRGEDRKGGQGANSIWRHPDPPQGANSIWRHPDCQPAGAPAAGMDPFARWRGGSRRYGRLWNW